ncbi:PREDICTED: uncharacterized protein LOC108376153, partial [Rhagoletis zephyria]|uniref:uncharacterized protein LOC108376153 n=1 Tax=Rhagoletis zephyria TaxID=28612 RepID=UPI0008112EAD
MVENYCNNGSTRRSFRSSSERRGFDCRPQVKAQKASSLRNSCSGPSTSAAAAAAAAAAASALESYNNSNCVPPKPQTSSSPTRYSLGAKPKMRTFCLETGAGMLTTAMAATTAQTPYPMSRNSCRPSAASLMRDPCISLSRNSNASCCCCPHCGKPQDPTQAAPLTPPPPPPPFQLPKRTLPCRSKPQPPKEEKPSPETEFKCRMRKLQLENLVKDQYCPGAIQSTIDCEEDFNELSFRLVFGCNPPPCTLPPVEPISLLEALCMRIELERCLLNNEASNAEARRGSRRDSPEMDEVDAFFDKKYKTPLNEALASLLKAERYFSMENPNE